MTVYLGRGGFGRFTVAFGKRGNSESCDVSSGMGSPVLVPDAKLRKCILKITVVLFKGMGKRETGDIQLLNGTNKKQEWN